MLLFYKKCNKNAVISKKINDCGNVNICCKCNKIIKTFIFNYFVVNATIVKNIIWYNLVIVEGGVNNKKEIKRDGSIVDYNPGKIEIAITKANAEVDEADQASSTQIKKIIKYIEGLKKKRILV